MRNLVVARISLVYTITYQTSQCTITVDTGGSVGVMSNSVVADICQMVPSLTSSDPTPVQIPIKIPSLQLPIPTHAYTTWQHQQWTLQTGWTVFRARYLVNYHQRVSSTGFGLTIDVGSTERTEHLISLSLAKRNEHNLGIYSICSVLQLHFLLFCLLVLMCGYECVCDVSKDNAMDYSL